MAALVGIINLTPDSFSDGGQNSDVSEVIKKIESMIQEGAEIIDIGAESTRPGATLLTEEDELRRLKKFLPEIAKNFAKKTILSIDSRHEETYRTCLDMGFKWLNDVSSSYSKNSIELAKKYNSKIVITHNLGVPANKTITMPEKDFLTKISLYAAEKINWLEENGVAKKNIIFDPGIGFGKTAQQSIEIIKHAESFKTLQTSLLFGHSRKSFLNELVEKTSAERDIETAIISSFLAEKGVDYLRVHDIPVNFAAIKISGALR